MRHDDSISVMRVSAMFMIVLYHCLCYNTGVWSGFDNPIQYYPIAIAGIHNIAYVGLDAFVFISGLLYYRIGLTGKYDNTRLFLGNKTERLLIPYVIWGLLLCIIFYGREHPIRILYGISHLWFLLMLFEIFVVFGLTKHFWTKFTVKGYVIALVCLLFIDGVVAKLGIIPNDGKGRVVLALQSTLDYLPVFFLGMLTEKFKIYERLSIPKAFAVLLMMVLFTIGAVPFAFHIPLSRLFQWLPTYSLIVITYYSLGKILCGRLGGGIKSSALMVLDRYSLSIYIIHHILIFVYLDYVPNAQSFMTNHYAIAPILLFIIVLPMSLGISYILSFLPGAKYIIGVGR